MKFSFLGKYATEVSKAIFKALQKLDLALSPAIAPFHISLYA